MILRGVECQSAASTGRPSEAPYSNPALVKSAVSTGPPAEKFTFSERATHTSFLHNQNLPVSLI